MNLKKFIVKSESLLIVHDDSEKVIRFPFSIDKILEFDNCYVVLLNVLGIGHLNENVFGVSFDGKILWQIKPQKYLDDRSPYTGISRKGNLLTAYNWSGMRYWLDPKSGKVIKEEYVK